MSRSNFTTRNEYVGTGSTKDYTFDFKITDLQHIKILVTSDTFVTTFSVKGNDITYLTGVDFNADTGGGTVHLASNLPANHHLTLLLADDAPTQPKEFKNKNDFTLKRFEDALDFMSGQIQRLAYLVGRSVKVSDNVVNAQTFNPTLPVNTTNSGVEDNRDKVLAIGSDNASIKLGPTTSSIFTASSDATTAANAAAVSAGQASASAIAAASSESAVAANTSIAASAASAANNSASAAQVAAGQAAVSANNAAQSEADIAANLASKANDADVIHLVGTETVTGKKLFLNAWAGDAIADGTTTGLLANLPAPNKLAVHLTSVGLGSVATITGYTPGQLLVITNKTTNPILIKNDYGTMADSIVTGLGTDLLMANDTTIFVMYNSILSRWHVIGGTGAGGGGGGGITTVVDAAARLALVVSDGLIVLQLDTDEIWAYDAGTLAWVRLAGPQGAFTFTDTTSIDFTYTPATQTLTAALKLSAVAADAANQKIDLDIQADGLRAQIPDSRVLGIQFAKIGSPTQLASIKDAYDHYNSAGISHGGALTNNGDGTISIATGEATLRTSAVESAPLVNLVFAAQLNMALTDNAVNYVYLDYNAGAPQFVVSTSISAFNGMDKVIAYTVAREGVVLYSVDSRNQGIDSNRKHKTMLLETQGFEHVIGGTALGEVATRKLSVSTGAFYYGLNKVTHPAFDTSAADTFNYYYRNGSGGWTKVTGQTQIDNLQYDNGSGALATLGANKFAVHWLYLINDTPSKLAIQYGQNEHNTLADAQNDTVPLAPPTLQGLGVLIGRVIIQKSSTTFASLESAFIQTFDPSTSLSHNGLSGLQGGAANDYTHLLASEYTTLMNMVPVIASQTIADGGTVTFTAGKYHSIVKVTSSAGFATLSATTAISNGTIDGQRMTLIGQSDSLTISITSAGNVICNGTCELFANSIIDFIWDNTAAKWIETNRSI